MSPRIVTRILAAVIFASGVVAALSLVLAAGRFGSAHVFFPTAAIPPLMFWIATSGVGAWLWRGSARSRIAAAVLFASQIPLIVVGSITYWWYTPGQVALSLQRVSGHTLIGVTTRLGPALSFWIGRPNASTSIGINLVAVVCLVALLRSSHSPDRRLGDRFAS